MNSQVKDSSKTKGPCVAIKPKGMIHFSSSKTKQTILIKSTYDYPLDFKFRSTAQRFFRADLVSGKIRANSVVAINVTFLPQLMPDENKNQRVEQIQIAFQGPVSTPKIRAKRLKVLITLSDPGISGLSHSMINLSSSPIDSVMFQSVIQEKPFLSSDDEENSPNNKDNGEKDDPMKSDTTSPPSPQESQTEKSDSSNLSSEDETVEKMSKRKVHSDPQPRAPKENKEDTKKKKKLEGIKWKKRKKKYYRQLFRFFPTYFGLLVIILLNQYFGFGFLLFKATVASFLLGIAIAYVQFEVFREEKKKNKVD